MKPKPSDAFIIATRLIETKPDGWKESDFEFLVSVEFANALLEYVNPFLGQPFAFKTTFFKGDEFKFRGYNFRVV